ncbi:hypothetical protein F5X98DRAFT_88680 [Xylaria grammica]|nr:hypothetical protein F5X98DRAFT_88680 [Xylaria grammica]
MVALADPALADPALAAPALVVLALAALALVVLALVVPAPVAPAPEVPAPVQALAQAPVQVQVQVQQPTCLRRTGYSPRATRQTTILALRKARLGFPASRLSCPTITNYKIVETHHPRLRMQLVGTETTRILPQPCIIMNMSNDVNELSVQLLFLVFPNIVFPESLLCLICVLNVIEEELVCS